MLEIGINKDLRFGSGTKLDDDGRIKIILTKGEAFTSALEMMEASAEEIPDESVLLLFVPNVKDKKGKKKDFLAVAGEIRRNYKYLSTMFALYLTIEELKKDFSVAGLYKDLNITKDNEEAMFTSATIVKTIFANLCTMTISCIKKYNLTEAEPFRLKMKRQSDDKAFPNLPFSPEKEIWVELMSIPEDVSKCRFTDWEKSKGFDNAEISLDSTDEADIEENVEDEMPELEEGEEQEYTEEGDQDFS